MTSLDGQGWPGEQSLNVSTNTRQYYEIKCKRKTRNQSIIYDWIHSYTVLRSGYIIGNGLEDTWITGRRPTQISANYNSDESEIEVEWDANS